MSVRSPAAKPDPFRGNLDAVHEHRPRSRVAGEEQVAVQVDVVAERRHRAPGGDAETGLDHATEHHAEPERARRVGHPDRLSDSAGLRELDVDAVRDLGARDDVGEGVTVLVDVDRRPRAAPQLRPARVTLPERLLDVLDAQGGELVACLERLVERPPLVDVDRERQIGDPADGADPLDVEPVPAAELQLEPPEARRCRLRPRAMSSGSPSHTVHEVGGPSRGSPRRRLTDVPSSFPWRS